MRLILIWVSIALLSGCAATVKRPESQVKLQPIAADSSSRVVLFMTGPDGKPSGSADWESFKGEWRSAMRAAAAQNALAFDVAEQAPAVPGPAGTLLNVSVIDYRYVSPVARYGFGIMTGNAFIEARVRFVDMPTGIVAGERFYSTSSSAWEGVFSAMTDKQVAVIASEVFRDFKLAGAAPSQGVSIPAIASITPAVKIAADAPKSNDSFAAERLAKGQACSPDPHAVLTAKGPGFESFSVACANGDALALRCEFGNCRVLK